MTIRPHDFVVKIADGVGLRMAIDRLVIFMQIRGGAL